MPVFVRSCKMHMSATGILAMKTKIFNHSITMEFACNSDMCMLLIPKITNSKLVVLFVTSVPFVKMLSVMEQ